MSSVPNSSSVASALANAANSSPTANNAALDAAFANLGPADFLNMMIAQLQNQSPLDPSDTDSMLQQLSTLSQVSSTQTLDTTLNSVLLGQNLSDAGILIGATIGGLSDDSQQIVGNVDSVTVTGGVPKLNIGSATMSLSNIETIYPPGSNVNTGSSGTTGTDTGATTGTGTDTGTPASQ